MIKKWNKEYVTWFFITVIGIIFFFLLGEKGAVICKDSKQYLEYRDFNGVMPLYPLFISLHRWLFGEELFMNAVFITQGILALLASIWLTVFISKEFLMGCISKVIIFFMSLFPYAYTLPEHVSSHEIMTESLAFPLFYVFSIIILYGIFHSKYSYILIDLVPLLALVMLRSHLLFLVVFYGIVVFFLLIKERNFFLSHKTLLVGIVVGAVVITLSFFFYRKCTSNKGDENSPQIVNAMFGRALYIMKETDEDAFYDKNTKAIFNKLFTEIDERKQRLDYAKDGLLRWEDISIGFNENMKLGNDLIYEYYKENRPDTDYYQRIDMIEKDKTILVKGILENNIDRYVTTFFTMLPSGFLSMVFIQKRSIYTLCMIYGVLFYLVYIFLMFRCLKRKQMKAGISALLILLLSILNVTITNLIHYGLQRYFVYTFGLMYIMVLTMFSTEISISD